ncbi:MAG: FixH family protein [Bacteroidales bacterium]|nr:FixH family protein [Bacteroidales bacterium]
MRKLSILSISLVALLTTACNDNDDNGAPEIEIPGITFDGDIDCCSAEEALQVYKFIQTVHIVPELSLSIDGKYDITAYSSAGEFHTGYNEIFFVATKKLSGNYVKNFDISNITPLMYMIKMDKEHSTAVGAVENFDNGILAVKRGWVSFVMSSSDGGSWTLSYDATVLDGRGTLERAGITVNALPNGQTWLKSFKAGDDTYYLSLVNPTDWVTGTNAIRAYISKKSAQMTTPYALANEVFTVEIDPRMPDMGNHSSPNNVALTRQDDGSYQGEINLTMSGLWRIHLTIKDASGNIVAGGDDLDDGFSSLYWDVTY